MVVSAIQCKRSLFPFEQTNKQTNSLEILFSANPPNMVLSLTMFPAITQRPVTLRYTAPSFGLNWAQLNLAPSYVGFGWYLYRKS